MVYLAIFVVKICVYSIRGCQTWTINYLSSSFLFCKYRLYLQIKSDWSNHKKPANITVTSRICFFGFPRSKFVFLFFTQNARRQCNKAYGEKQRVHFDANTQAVSGRAFATKKSGEDGRPSHVHVNGDDDEGECSTD